MLHRIVDGVFVHRSEILQNNAVVVASDTGALVVDPGLTETELCCLAADLRDLGQTVVAGFSTHPDWDHVLWHRELGAATRYATARGAEVMSSLRADPGWESDARQGLPPEIDDEVPLDLYGLLTPLPSGTEAVPWAGPRVRVVEHPAHAPGHAALLVEDAAVLIAGDMLSDVFVPMLDEFTEDNDPVEDYLVGLQTLEDLSSSVDTVIPGHGSIATGDEVRRRIEQDRGYLQALREGREPDDPRLTSPAPGWEWVRDIHAGQAESVGSSHARSR